MQRGASFLPVAPLGLHVARVDPYPRRKRGYPQRVQGVCSLREMTSTIGCGVSSLDVDVLQMEDVAVTELDFSN
ncbi:hypothetical protein BDY19DRAFT_543374 [Irpex rosettiformis]|uniref:Uncharacterized protein n=1 Tax=Irpex rosettiformis TaxID=378272 RepID=A0ACB8TQJ7_9APHY|nr:hypothetical protein BDY19DRAFT_543374 [Irpex rosettiformis]